MPSLLSVPQEIRDQILEEVVLSIQDAPTYTPSNRGGRGQPQDYDSLHGYDTAKRVKWPKNRAVHPADSVLLVSKQLNCEVKAAWKRVRHLLPCHADVMFVEECELWPTYLSAYNPATHLERVHCNFRVEGLPDAENFEDLTKTAFQKNIWAEQEADAPVVHRMFWQLFSLFLRIGPRPGPQSSVPFRASKHITISNLEINVLSPPTTTHLLPDTPENYQLWSRARSVSGRDLLTPEEKQRWHDIVQTPVRPEWLCTWLAGNIRRLLGMDFRIMSEGKLFYERIGSIEIMLDGKSKAVFNLGEMLSKLPKPDESDPDHHWGWLMSDLRKDWYTSWYKSVLQERAKAGLPVVLPKPSGEETNVVE